MTPNTDDAAGLVAELRARTTYACVQPTHLHGLDYRQGRKILDRAADLLESQAKALRDAEAERIETNRQAVYLSERIASLEARLKEAEGHLATALRYAARNEAGPEIDAARAFLNAVEK